MSFIELLLCSLFYQAALYLAIRLAHQGFTLGELGVVIFGASVLFMEGFNITVARVSLRLAVIFPENVLIVCHRYGLLRHHISGHTACLLLYCCTKLP
jgi:hypothetical protein